MTELYPVNVCSNYKELVSFFLTLLVMEDFVLWQDLSFVVTENKLLKLFT